MTIINTPARSYEERVAAALDFDSDFATLFACSCDEDERIRALMTLNPAPRLAPNTLLGLLAVLTTDKSVMVRKTIATNPMISGGILHLLRDDVALSVRLRVAGNPSTFLGDLEGYYEDVNELAPIRIAAFKNFEARLV